MNYEVGDRIYFRANDLIIGSGTIVIVGKHSEDVLVNDMNVGYTPSLVEWWIPTKMIIKKLT